jgi:class 3 adenylate cyclase
VEVGVKGRRALDRIYRRIDALLTEKLSSPALVDPFEEPAALASAQRHRLHRYLERLVQAGVDPAVVDQLGHFLAQAPAQEVARIRPLALARRLGLDSQQMVAACLYGAREGLLVLLWDILCPVCRIPAQVQDTLRALRDHGHCEACNLDFELDFARSVEMIFRAHPEIRTTDLRTYCVSGPSHSPHVAAQIRVGPGERIELELTLPEGDYRLRGPQLPFALDFRVRPGVAAHRWDLTLSHGAAAEWPHTLGAGGQVLAVTNDYDCDVVVRIERTAPRDDILTAARAATLPLFRKLFPQEVLASGQLVSVATMTFLVTALDRANHLYEELGDAQAFSVLHEHFRLLGEGIRQGGGALVKTVGEGVVAVFSETTAAVRVGLGLQALLARAEATRSLRLRVGIHCGPALATTLNDHLDYFGTTVSQAMQLPQWARGGELILTAAVAAEPGVSALLRKLGLQGELLSVDLPGLTGAPLQRLLLPGVEPAGLRPDDAAGTS